MDIKIRNKDIALGENGQTERAEGLEEYLQRALISMSAVRGEFCYKRDLGAFKALTGISDVSELMKEAEAALADQPELTVKNAIIEEGTAVMTIDTPFGTGEVRL